MRMEQYIQIMDYALWDVIKNGNSIPKTQTINNIDTVIPPTTAEEKFQRRNKVKARSTLIMGLPNEHQLKFNSFKDAKSLLEAIEKNLDQTFDKLQKLASQLELLDEVISQEDINKKFLRSLPSEWGMHVGVNTANEVNTASSQVNAASSLNIDNMSDVVICAFLASQPNSTHLVNEDLEQIHLNDLEEMYLKWKMAMLTMRARRFSQKYRKEIESKWERLSLVSCDGLGGYDWSDQAKEEPTNYALMADSTSLASSSDSEVSDDEEEKVEKKEVKPSINRINFVKATTYNNPRETVKNVVNAAKAKAKHKVVKGKKGNAVKASACWGNLQEHLQDKRVVDSGCSRHMTGDMYFLIDYKEIDGGYVAFGGNPKGGKIIGKAKIKFCYGKKVVINEASIRHDLTLNDAEGTSCLSNAVIFKELARMGTMASAIICLANNQKFNFSKYILDNLKKNLDAGVPFYMFPRFIQVFLNHQLGEMSHHKGVFVNPSLTKKVFANRKRVGTRFYRAVTPLFGTMMVQAIKEVGDLPTDVQDTPIPDAPSSFQPQRKHKPRRKQRMEIEVSPTETNTKEYVPTHSNDPLPSEMKSSHKAKIEELESRVEKLEEKNKSLTNELKSSNTRVESLTINETVVDKEESSKQGRKITDIDADAEVMEIAKIIIDELNAANEKPVSAAPINITTAQPSESTKTIVDITTAPKAKGIVFHDKEKSTTRTTSLKSQAKDKGKAKLVKEPKILKSRKAQIALDEEVTRRIDDEWNANMKDNIDWNEVVKQVQSRQSDARTRKEKVEKDQPVKKKKDDELKHDNAKKQKLEEQQEAEELKKNLEIVHDDEDDVFVIVTPLSSKPPTIVDYKIYKEGKKEHF
nr:hypothetical protein [Tanacetum cinerariifolium]